MPKNIKNIEKIITIACLDLAIKNAINNILNNDIVKLINYQNNMIFIDRVNNNFIFLSS